MSLKSENSGMNSSSGFKKRVLRPVSTQKQNNLKINMKNSRCVNLNDEISLKKKYNNVCEIIDCILLQVNEHLNQSVKIQQESAKLSISSGIKLSGKQYLKHQILRRKHKFIKTFSNQIKNSNQINSSTKQSIKKSSSIYNQNISKQKTTDQILQELRFSNIQNAIRYLYQQKIQQQDLIEKLMYCFGSAILQKSQKSQFFNQLKGQEQSFQIVAKISHFLIKELLNSKSKVQEIHIQTQQTIKQTPKLKFKTIFSARQNEQTDQIDRLKIQVQNLKTINQTAQQTLKITLIKLDQIKPKQCIQVTNWPKKFETMSKQMKLIYEQVIAKKNQQIQRLNAQILSLNQNLNKITTTNEFMQDKDKKTAKPNSYKFGQNSSQGSQFTTFIQEQFQKMRNGFSKKLQKIQFQIIEKEKQLKKTVFKLQKDLQTTQRQKRIVLKKYQFLLISKN